MHKYWLSRTQQMKHNSYKGMHDKISKHYFLSIKRIEYVKYDSSIQFMKDY